MSLLWTWVVATASADCPAPPPVRVPAVEALVDQLDRGHLVLDGTTFRPGQESLIDGVDPVLEQAARALSRTRGRFAVFVPAEAEATMPPDTVLGRRRTEHAFRRLIEAGSNPNRLVIAGAVLPGGPLQAVADACQAKVELYRVAMDGGARDEEPSGD